MKLEKLFYVKENKLYRISDDETVDLSSLEKVLIKWSEVELEDELYNEEFLAELRNKLKQLDESNRFAILIPVVDKELKTEEQAELFTNAFNHTARRIKDCVSVAGFFIPKEIQEMNYTQSFTETLAVKHEQYVYFTDDKNTGSDFVMI